MALKVILTIIFSLSQCTVQGEKLIVGGTLAKAGEFPYMVSLQGITGAHLCGGTLLNAITVLTAAHCTYPDPSLDRVRVGSLTTDSGGQLVQVSDRIIHPNYDDKTLENDIALWKLSTRIEPNSVTGYAVLPEPCSDPLPGSIATVAGWGRLADSLASPYSTELKRVSLPVIARNTCADVYQNKTKEKVTENVFCAGLEGGGKDACKGDSGGPIVNAATGVLIGLVSWGEGCARPNAYGVYTRLGNYVDFVRNNMWTV